MITRLAVSGYRSLREVRVAFGRLTVVTGANGSGKSSLYRSLRLLSEAAQGRLVASLAGEGGLPSTLWAGPEAISARMRRGEVPVQGMVRSGSVSLKLGFSGADEGYAIDLGFPSHEGAFALDPAIKTEALWTGELLGRTALFAERRGPAVRLRRSATGEWRASTASLSAFDSMLTHCADPDDGIELLHLRERLRSWRFYDTLRTDREAPARRPQVMTYTPILADDGADLAAAVATIRHVGDGELLDRAVEDAFAGARLDVGGGGFGHVEMRQAGLLRPLGAAELSEGTLRYLLLLAALLSPRPPGLMVLNEPEASLHPALIGPLARLLADAAATRQVVVVSHNAALVEALKAYPGTVAIALRKDLGETVADGEDAPRWTWPAR